MSPYFCTPERTQGWKNIAGLKSWTSQGVFDLTVRLTGFRRRRRDGEVAYKAINRRLHGLQPTSNFWGNCLESVDGSHVRTTGMKYQYKTEVVEQRIFIRSSCWWKESEVGSLVSLKCIEQTWPFKVIWLNNHLILSWFICWLGKGGIYSKHVNMKERFQQFHIDLHWIFIIWVEYIYCNTTTRLLSSQQAVDRYFPWVFPGWA